MSERELILGEDAEGGPAYGYVINDFFIVDPTVSECGRFDAHPLRDYGLTNAEVRKLVRANAELARARRVPVRKVKASREYAAEVRS
jgi:hypothetical protein